MYIICLQGIRNAGLAVSVGTWSSINVLVSFLFGIFIFQERVKSIVSVAFAFLTLIVGLIGMSRFSSEQRKMILEKKTKVPSKNAPQLESSERLGMSERGIMAVTGLSSMEIEPLIDDEDIIMGEEKDPSAQRFFFFGGRLVLTRRQTGIVGAVLNGVWGGLNLVPLHYAMQYDGLSGAGYLISYATGAFIVNVLLWVFLFVYILHQKRGSLKDTLDALPKWHLDQLLGPGLLAGLLYSIGNFSAMISVAILGQAVGFGTYCYRVVDSCVQPFSSFHTAFCQMQLFVSGLWGVFVFKEIKGTVLPWFLSAGVAVIGIIWLSYEHESVVIQE